ncbi:MAG TPA: hypothetical protein VGL99_34315 [Chloroflexota bacterium]
MAVVADSEQQLFGLAAFGLVVTLRLALLLSLGLASGLCDRRAELLLNRRHWQRADGGAGHVMELTAQQPGAQGTGAPLAAFGG